MKQRISRTLLSVFAVSLLTGCSANTSPPAKTPNTPNQPPVQGQASTAKTGLSISTSLANSTNANAENEGLVQADAIIVGVLVDADGKIIDCAIDSAQTNVSFDAAGQITTPLDAKLKTKNELGAEYGMGKASKIGKEWNEQAAALAAYVIGKTADEVRGIAVDDELRAADADLKASVTISIGNYLDAIDKAVANASALGAGMSDKISLGTVTKLSIAESAGAEGGQVEVYSSYTAITTNDSGKITSCVIDAGQAKANFDASGKFTSDITSPVQSKNEIGLGYGLKESSSIGKEWNEQAAAFANYVIGKTADEVKGIAVNESGAPADADLTASVTIGIKDFQDIIVKAAK